MRTFSPQTPPPAANQADAGLSSARPDRPLPPPALPAPELPRRRHMAVALSLGLTASFFWLGIGGAYLWGYLGPQGLAQLPLQVGVLTLAAMALPPLLFLSIAILMARSLA